GIMPGLYILSSWEPLPLKSSKVKACANGYSLSITAHLTYTNPHEEFQHFLSPPSTSPGVYLSLHMAILTPALLSPLRVATAINVPPFHTPLTPKLSFLCPGHLVLDEDVERSTFIIVTGTLWALESLSITLSTAQELATLPDGALRFLLPPVLTPRVPLAASSHSHSAGSSTGTEPSGWGAEGLPCCHLFPAGLESPSHALRADADPWASSATTTCVTLAEPHRYDRDVEIILYPCGEGGRCHRRVRGRWGTALKASGASPSPLQHRAALNIPVNTAQRGQLQCQCEATLPVQPPLQQRECRQATLHQPRSSSLLPGMSHGWQVRDHCEPGSPCGQETLQRACEHLGRLQADAGSTNLLAALRWVLAQPLHHGYPRQLFLFTNTAAGITTRLPSPSTSPAMASHCLALSHRCFNFGMGPRVCRRLLKGMAKVSRGRAEFLSPAERLQPKLIKSLKKAIEPAVSDITIDWYVPDSMEALLSPTEFPALYPGDHLISYCVLYSIAHFRSRRPQVWPALPWHGEDGTFPQCPLSARAGKGLAGAQPFPPRRMCPAPERAAIRPSALRDPGTSPWSSSPGVRRHRSRVSGAEAGAGVRHGGCGLTGCAFAGQVWILHQGETSGRGFTTLTAAGGSSPTAPPAVSPPAPGTWPPRSQALMPPPSRARRACPSVSPPPNLPHCPLPRLAPR
uniref:Uncharacterized protein n=1 Tax=Melopsittacus undulatus TaxID=13146 RepID=A0A8V5FWC7_MELUD